MSPQPPVRSPIAIHECPSCQGALAPRKLICTACDLTLEGSFAAAWSPSPDARNHGSPNEFASLPDEDLHLLRIFVHCEGSIREMESALGLSYPTIKGRLARLRERLKTAAPSEPAQSPSAKSAKFRSVEDVLEALERGDITATESVQHIRKLRGV